MHTETIEYQADITLKGYLAYEPNQSGKQLLFW